jgi:5-methylcytosine-specific restriction endonuclease McrA
MKKIKRILKLVRRLFFKNQNKRWARLKKAKRGLSWEERKAIALYYARCPRGYEVDHIRPLSKGGLHRIRNLQYLKRAENRSKGSKFAFWKRLFY